MPGLTTSDGSTTSVGSTTSDDLVKSLNDQYNSIVSNLETEHRDNLETNIDNYLSTVNKNNYLNSNSGDIVQLYMYDATKDNSKILINKKTAIIIYDKYIYIGFDNISVPNVALPGTKKGFGYVKIAKLENDNFEKLDINQIIKHIYTPTSTVGSIFPRRGKGGGIKNLIDVFSKQFKGLKDNKNKTKRKKKLKRGKSSRISH